MKTALLKKNLVNHSENIDNLIFLLEKHFKNKNLFHAQVYSCFGFEYPIEDKFIASNKTDSVFKNFYDPKSENYILLRFFCNSTILFQGNNFKDFTSNLKTDENTPIFFITPFSDLEQEESSIIIKPNFEIKIKIYINNIIVTIHNYNENLFFFDSLQNEINLIFKNESKIKIKLLKRKKTNLQINENIKSTIQKIKKHMSQGDCYLANITTTQTLNKNKKFITMSQFFYCWINNFSRFGIYYNNKKIALASFSPERFLSTNNGFIISEPIKGTLKTKYNLPNFKDAYLIWNKQKEILEHTMIVDLMRNDLHEICLAESITVYKPFFARISGNLIQMQSFIVGKLKNKLTLSDCLEKTLPAGSITGTPKRKVCEIIHTLEKNKRGYYTGVCGIQESDGNFDSTLLIRSVFMGKRGVYFGVGAGITSLSNSQFEFNEFKTKLNSFLPILESLLK